MSRSITTLPNPLGSVIYENTNLGITVDANIRSGPTRVYQVTVDNTLNVAASYLAMFNAVTATLGSTVPDMILYVPAAVKANFTLDFAGINFATALSLACTTLPNGTVAPASAVSVAALMT